MKILKKYLKKIKNIPKTENFIFCLTTLVVHNFLLVTEHLWKTSEMEFSDRVDIVLKNPIEKYYFFAKLGEIMWDQTLDPCPRV